MPRTLGTISLNPLVEETLTISHAIAVNDSNSGPPEGVVAVG